MDKFEVIDGGKSDAPETKPAEPELSPNTYQITTRDGTVKQATGYFLLFGGLTNICPSYDSPLLEPLLSVPTETIAMIERVEEATAS